ncbi:Hypothetical predicted protein, partial [Paramuricea clavata]
LLERSQDCWSDGTFKTCPRPFAQLYSIHIRVYDINRPVVFALLHDKSRRTYQRLLHRLLQRCPNWNPRTWMGDFEQAAIQAVMTVFPQVTWTDCLFHLTQSMWRNAQSFGLTRNFDRDGEMSLWMRTLPALAMVPEEDVIGAFETL